MNGKLGDNNHFCIYISSLCVDMVNAKNWILLFKVYLPIFFVLDIVKCKERCSSIVPFFAIRVVKLATATLDLVLYWIAILKSHTSAMQKRNSAVKIKH